MRRTVLLDGLVGGVLIAGLGLWLGGRLTRPHAPAPVREVEHVVPEDVHEVPVPVPEPAAPHGALVVHGPPAHLLHDGLALGGGLTVSELRAEVLTRPRELGDLHRAAVRSRGAWPASVAWIALQGSY